MDHQQKRLAELSASTRRSLRSLSLAVGRNHAYFQQYVERGKPQTLPEKIRYALAEELGVDESELRDVDNIGLSNRRLPAKTPMAPGGQFQGAKILTIGPKDLPIYGSEGRTKNRGIATIMITEQATGYAERPASLIGVPDAFGLFVHDSVMEPRYFSGELLHLHPGKPVRPNDWVVIKLDDGEALVRQLLTRNAKHITVLQLNPNRKKTISVSTVDRIYRIVGTAEE